MGLLGLGTAVVVAALGRGVVHEKEELAALQPPTLAFALTVSTRFRISL